MGVFHKGQMSDSLLTAMFIVLSGGFQDAYTYVCRGKVFANAQTGNIVLMSTHLFDGRYADSLRYMIPIVAFLVGTFLAEAVHSRLKHYEKLHWRQIVLAVEIVLLFVVGFLPQEWNAAANALVSFVCALQVQPSGKCAVTFMRAPCASAICEPAQRRYMPFFKRMTEKFCIKRVYIFL